VLQQLPTLQNLLLSHNQLHGRLTCELATPSLAELGLAANQLTGTVPPCLLASPPLQELYLGSNGLEGQLPAPPPDSRLLIISAFANVSWWRL
jgi:Leucine-rich repeat (LRR) protein